MKVVSFPARLVATGCFVSSVLAFGWVVLDDAGPMIGRAVAALPTVEAAPEPLLAAMVAPTDSGIDSSPVEMPEHAWSPPPWLGGEEVLSIPAMDRNGPRRGGPQLRSASVFIYDADADEVLYERRADEVRPVASITKLVSALTVASLEADLDREICIGAEQYPTRNGALSKLNTGDCLSGWDVVGAALVASDNRAAMAMAAVAGEDVDRFVEQMNVVSAELDMHSSSWSDPSGLEDENLSTARDIAKATLAVSAHPVLAPIASAPWWDVHKTGEAFRRVNSTDHLVGRKDLEILAAKTGFTQTAQYCFSTVLRTDDGHRVVVTLLGANGTGTRWADMARVLDWLERRTG